MPPPALPPLLLLQEAEAIEEDEEVRPACCACCTPAMFANCACSHLPVSRLACWLSLNRPWPHQVAQLTTVPSP